MATRKRKGRTTGSRSKKGVNATAHLKKLNVPRKPPEKPTLLPYSKQGSIDTKNYYAPLRTDMETDTTEAEKQASESTADEGQKPTPKTPSRSPPIVLTSTVNVIRLQKNLKSISKGPFELRNTK
jgi:hypothetical protein